MFGSHLSIAGSMTNALEEAEHLGMDCVQVFTKNQQQWKVKPLSDESIRSWRETVARLGWERATVSHASYLINLASPDDELWEKSIDLMQVEIERCEALGIPFLVHHPGAFTTSTRDEGHERIVRAYVELFGRTSGVGVVSCLENTVGSGSNMGRTFEELASLRAGIVDRTGSPERVGFCFDTCHAHAGGYDLSTEAGAEGVLEAFDEACGLETIRVVHVNDSKGEAGSRKDRHAHIGEGTIGVGTSHKVLSRSGFGPVIRRLHGVPLILETPKGETPRGTAYDTLNLRRLRKLLAGPETGVNTGGGSIV